MSSGLRIAVVGAGPVGLALALLAARRLPHATVTLFDARAQAQDVGGDPRTLALAWGSVLTLRQLAAWPRHRAAPIETVHVSQAPPSRERARVRLRASDHGVPMLGAVIAYGPLVAALQEAWRAEVAAAQAARLASCFGTAVRGVEAVGEGAEVRWADGRSQFDLAVIAEGGVFGSRTPTSETRPGGAPLMHDYRQSAWVGEVSLRGGTVTTAYERFTRTGPVALLPLPPPSPLTEGRPAAVARDDGLQRAALVWCVATEGDPVPALDEAQRLAVLASLLPPEAGRPVALSSLKRFPLGLRAEPTLVRGRVVRIGNAAQTLHPVAGQGLNLGLRDAQSLVQALIHAPVASGPCKADIDAALRRVEWARAPDRWATIALTDALARSFTWDAPGLGAARGLALAALDAAGPVKRTLARQMMFGRR